MISMLKWQNWLKEKKAGLYTYFLKREIGAVGKNSKIFPPFHSHNMSKVYLGNNVGIMANGWIDVIEEYATKKYNPRIDIGDGTYIGRGVHIIAALHMKIGKQVVFADKVYVTDNLHGYEDINKSIFDVPLETPGPVTIEDQVWLGENVCVLPNVTIGKHSVIGSNSVVTKSIPPYSVAVGVPAKVIKRFNEGTQKWERV